MAKVGRNDPCYCGSGLKYKRCCIEIDRAKAGISLVPDLGVQSPTIRPVEFIKPKPKTFLSRLFNELARCPLAIFESTIEVNFESVAAIASKVNKQNLFINLSLYPNQLGVRAHKSLFGEELSIGFDHNGNILIKNQDPRTIKLVSQLLALLVRPEIRKSAEQNPFGSDLIMFLDSFDSLLRSKYDSTVKPVSIDSIVVGITSKPADTKAKKHVTPILGIRKENHESAIEFMPTEPDCAPIKIWCLFSNSKLLPLEEVLTSPYFYLIGEMQKPISDIPSNWYAQIPGIAHWDSSFINNVILGPNKKTYCTPMYWTPIEYDSLNFVRFGSPMELYSFSGGTDINAEQFIAEFSAKKISNSLLAEITCALPNKGLLFHPNSKLDRVPPFCFDPIAGTLHSNNLNLAFRRADLSKFKLSTSNLNYGSISLKAESESEFAKLFNQLSNNHVRLVLHNQIDAVKEPVKLSVNMNSSSKASNFVLAAEEYFSYQFRDFFNYFMRIFDGSIGALLELLAVPLNSSRFLNTHHPLYKHKGFYRALIVCSWEAAPLLDQDLPIGNKKFKDHMRGIVAGVIAKATKLSNLEEKFGANLAELQAHEMQKISEFTEQLVFCCIGRNSHIDSIGIVDDKIFRLDLLKEVFGLTDRILATLTSVLGPDFFTKTTAQSMRFEVGSISLCTAELSFYNVDGQKLLASALSSQGLEATVDYESIETLDPGCLTGIFDIDDATMDAGLDWFALNPKVFFNGKEISQIDAQKIAEGGLVFFSGRFYFVDSKKIPTTKWLNYFWDKIKSSNKNKKPNKWKWLDQIVAVEPNNILNMLAMKASGISVIGGEKWKKVSLAFDKLTVNREEIKSHLAQDLDISLRPFQELGTQWMLDLYDIGLGGILADDMGLGKTVQSIAFLRALLRRNELGKCLLVVPTSLIYNWKAELERFAGDIPFVTLQGKSDLERIKDFLANHSSQGLLITTYGLVAEYEDLFQSLEWNVVLCDEAQNLKNIVAKRTGVLRALRARSKYCLTGTPMENHYGEFYSLVDFCVSGALGPYDEFASTYIPNRVGTNLICRDDVEFLRLKTAPIVLRRTKSKILDELPEKTETVIHLDFETQQKKIYRNTALSWNRQINGLVEKNGEKKAQLEMLTALMRLRQACSHPVLVPNTKYAKQPPKFEEALTALSQLIERGESVVVFTNFKGTLDLLQKELINAGIFCLTISGEVSSQKRVEVLDTFNKSEAPLVLLMTQKTGGVGLNLTRARYVFHIEPWWNPQSENQATDRVHRIGQKLAVQVYRYIMRDSVEEKIQLLKGYKESAFKDLFEEEPRSLDSAAYAKNFLKKSDFDYLLNA